MHGSQKRNSFLLWTHVRCTHRQQTFKTSLLLHWSFNYMCSLLDGQCSGGLRSLPSLTELREFNMRNFLHTFCLQRQDFCPLFLTVVVRIEPWLLAGSPTLALVLQRRHCCLWEPLWTDSRRASLLAQNVGWTAVLFWATISRLDMGFADADCNFLRSSVHSGSPEYIFLACFWLWKCNCCCQCVCVCVCVCVHPSHDFTPNPPPIGALKGFLVLVNQQGGTDGFMWAKQHSMHKFLKGTKWHSVGPDRPNSRVYTNSYGTNSTVCANTQGLSSMLWVLTDPNSRVYENSCGPKQHGMGSYRPVSMVRASATNDLWDMLICVWNCNYCSILWSLQSTCANQCFQSQELSSIAGLVTQKARSQYQVWQLQDNGWSSSMHHGSVLCATVLQLPSPFIQDLLLLHPMTSMRGSHGVPGQYPFLSDKDRLNCAILLDFTGDNLGQLKCKTGKHWVCTSLVLHWWSTQKLQLVEDHAKDLSSGWNHKTVSNVSVTEWVSTVFIIIRTCLWLHRWGSQVLDSHKVLTRAVNTFLQTFGEVIQFALLEQIFVDAVCQCVHNSCMAWNYWTVLNLCPLNCLFKCGNRKKSQGARSGLQGGWPRVSMSVSIILVTAVPWVVWGLALSCKIRKPDLQNSGPL